MVTSIRRKAINAPDCPVESGKCPTPTDRFRVQVLKNEGGEPKPVYIHVFGMPCDDELIIEREYESECDPLWSPMTCGGRPLALSHDYPDIMLVVPGTYRFSTASGQVLDDVDFAIEECPVHVEYADLWFKQQQLCCCRENK